MIDQQQPDAAGDQPGLEVFQAQLGADVDRFGAVEGQRQRAELQRVGQRRPPIPG